MTPHYEGFKVGDTDPTRGSGATCSAVHEIGWACTGPEGHTGQHIAGGGQYIVLFVWQPVGEGES